MSVNDKFLETIMGRVLLKYEQDQNINPIAPSRHSLDGTLVVSLTSYKPRFKFLHLTLKTLLNQVIVPDIIVLWVAESEIRDLPESVLLLKDRITILPTADLRSYKKIIPSLARYPDAFIVICDDDSYYPRNWLSDLVDGANDNRHSIVARSVHRFHYLSGGQLAPCIDWSFDVQDHRARQISVDTIPVGSGGVLYPPRSLHADVSDVALFTRLCPSNDDLWLYVMARLNGYLPVKVGAKFLPVYWPGTQEVGLFRANLFENKDDIAIQNLIEYFGPDVFGVEQSRLQAAGKSVERIGHP